MLPSRRLAISALAAFAVAAPAAAAPVVGQSAPAFTAKDADGRTRSLSEFAGKTVVLEWTNDGCPYVQKHYKAGAMQKLQKDAAKDGVVWLTLVSSAPGKQGHLSETEAKGWKAQHGAGSSALLLDPAGQVGKAYDARTTPHMYVVDGSGKLVYMGGIDDKPSADPASLQGATNYVTAALSDLKAGRAVATPVSRPYGCSVKYAE
ncbi:MAG: thioredoxin family protein [Phenylobacterium sp.]|uniref:thioredoxin family protein n=1 Tax=Phenylobacterium sp. TaxID=1871053 RepID=UPI00391C486D